MSIKQTIIKSIILAPFIFIVGLMVQPQSVSAEVTDEGWCRSTSEIGDDYTSDKSSARYDNCLEETWNRLPSNVKANFGGDNAQGYDNYVDRARGCVESPWFGINTRGGECVNALVYCNTRSMDVSRCEDNELIQRVAIGCNHGSDTDEHGCDPIRDINQPIVEGIEKPVEQLIGESCTRINGESAAEANQRCESLYNDVVRHCSDQSRQPGFESPNNDGGDIGDMEYLLADRAAYEQCLNDEMRNRTTDPTECESRGGNWNENGSPKCESPAPPPPPDPCEGRGGIDPNDPSKCLDGSEPDEADGVDGDSPFVPDSRCGKARVNLLACGTDEGNLAFQNLLKIAAIVLSFAVGAAAVAGLAWASVLYAKAEDNEGNVAASKELIRNIVIGLLLYMLLLALVNWLVPGGLFGP